MRNGFKVIFACSIIFCSSFLVYYFALPKSNRKIEVESTLQKDESLEKENSSMVENLATEKEEPKEEEVLEEPIMSIQIPKIGVYNLIYAKDSKENTVDKNVQIMKESNYPDEPGGNVLLGGHSGTGRLAYFKNLSSLEKGDEIILKYKGTYYRYKVENSYRDDKDGSILVPLDSSKNRLTLFTCMPNDSYHYLVVISEQVKE